MLSQWESDGSVEKCLSPRGHDGHAFELCLNGTTECFPSLRLVSKVEIAVFVHVNLVNSFVKVSGYSRPRCALLQMVSVVSKPLLNGFLDRHSVGFSFRIVLLLRLLQTISRELCLFFQKYLAVSTRHGFIPLQGCLFENGENLISTRLIPHSAPINACSSLIHSRISTGKFLCKNSQLHIYSASHRASLAMEGTNDK